MKFLTLQNRVLQQPLKTRTDSVVSIGLIVFLASSLLGCQSESKVAAKTAAHEPTRKTASSESWKVPKQIILIRHGEKIDDINPGLSVQGCERAFQLPGFFNSLSASFAGIFAQQPNKAGSSLRPLQTVAPTASLLHLKINNSYRRSEIDALAQEILTGESYKGNTVIVSWEHSMIPDLAQKLGVSLTSDLGRWPGDVFDQAWIITYPTGDISSATLAIVAEHVLPTDVSKEESGIDHWGDDEAHQVDDTIQIPQSVIAECKKGNQSLNDLVRQLTLRPAPGI